MSTVTTLFNYQPDLSDDILSFALTTATVTTTTTSTLVSTAYTTSIATPTTQYTSVTVSITTTVTTTAAASSPTNLVQDPGFEDVPEALYDTRDATDGTWTLSGGATFAPNNFDRYDSSSGNKYTYV